MIQPTHQEVRHSPCSRYLTSLSLQLSNKGGKAFFGYDTMGSRHVHKSDLNLAPQGLDTSRMSLEVEAGHAGHCIREKCWTGGMNIWLLDIPEYQNTGTV